MRHGLHCRFCLFFGVRLSTLLASMIIIGAMGCNGQKIRESPKEIIGTWVTSEPRHDGCTLEITRYRIIFMNPLSVVSDNYIREVKKSADETRTVYQIFYEDEGNAAGTLTIYYSRTESGEAMQIRHQEKTKWTRALLPEGCGVEASG